jgi:hypothetical protein
LRYLKSRIAPGKLFSLISHCSITLTPLSARTEQMGTIDKNYVITHIYNMKKTGDDDNRFTALEARVEALERAERQRTAEAAPAEEAKAAADPFWALTALKQMALPAPGAVL